MVKYVTYDGLGTAYLVMLRKATGDFGGSGAIEHSFLVGKNDTVAVDDFTFKLLEEQGHIGPSKLKEVPESILRTKI